MTGADGASAEFLDHAHVAALVAPRLADIDGAESLAGEPRSVADLDAVVTLVEELSSGAKFAANAEVIAEVNFVKRVALLMFDMARRVDA